MDVPLAYGDVAIEGDEAAFGRLLRPELDRVYQLAGYLLGSAPEAEDAVHDAVVRAWDGFGGLRSRDRFGPWLTRIVVNGCRDRLRRRRALRVIPLEGCERALDDPFAETLARDAVGRALDTLGPEQRAVVVLHYWNDCSVAEIARILGVPGGTVKWRLRAACRRMQAELQRNEREALR